MDINHRKFRTIWANFDANRHMRHTAYNDYAAEMRVLFLQEQGFDIDHMETIRIGPILFREETKFLKEIKMGTEITVDIALLKLSKNGGRFSFLHHIYNEKQELAATITVDGAWMDLDKRKLCLPPEAIVTAMNNLQKSDQFEWYKTGSR